MFIACASPAQAALTFDSSFGSSGSGPGQFSSPQGIAVNDTTGNVYVVDRALFRVQEFSSTGTFIRMWGKGVDQSTGADICTAVSGDVCGPGSLGEAGGEFSPPRGIAVDNSPGLAAGSVYVQEDHRVQRFSEDGQFVSMWGKDVDFDTGADICTAASGDTCKAAGTTSENTPGEFSSGTLIEENGTGISVDGAGYVYVADMLAQPARVQKFDPSGVFVGQIAGPFGGFAFRGISGLTGLATDATGDAYVADPLQRSVKKFNASDFTPSGSAASYSLILGVGGTDTNGPKTVAIDPSNQYLFTLNNELHTVPNSPCVTPPGKVQMVEYHPGGQVVDCTVTDAGSAITVSSTHKLYLADGSGVRIFDTPIATPPVIGVQNAAAITANSARIDTQIDANLGETTYRVEYGTSPCSVNPCASTDESSSIGAAIAPKAVSGQLSGLSPDTAYYYRVIATNSAGSAAGPDRTFSTYPNAGLDPDCPNNLARQQTGSALLLDCRGYELVSAEDTGGYNVESNLIAGQTPFGGYPQAKDGALYAIHDGGVPNAGNPTNRGLDPYLATRDAADERWNTRYVGIPADDPFAASPFASPLLAADASLDTFAFGGSDLCAPCFADGTTGIPTRLADGSLVQGMAGSLEPGPTATPVGLIEKPLSSDGSHLVFGSLLRFEADGKNNSGDVSIYDRNLHTGFTQVVSKNPAGNNLTCLQGAGACHPPADNAGIAELDISNDGSRIVIGQLVSTDAAGNHYYHLYMHIGETPGTIDLTPGATKGVLYDGMTATGSMVYFTAADPLATAEDQDSDASADIFRADVDAEAMSATLARVSTGTGTGNTNLCNPVDNSAHVHWNTVGGGANCDAVAIGGDGGVASASGSIYFLSPELLDGSNGVQNAPNLYLSRPGSAPTYVTTLESALSGPQPPTRTYRFQGNLGSFTKSAGVAVDHASGSVYALDIGAKTVSKFDASGNPVNFTAGSGVGTNHLNGADAPCSAFSPLSTIGLPDQLAVDQSSGNFYVPDYNHGKVDVFSSTGDCLSQISVVTPSAVAVNPVTHDVYVTSFSGNAVNVFTPAGAAVTSFSTNAKPIGVAVDSSGTSYVVDGTQTTSYNSSGSPVGVLDPEPSFGVAVDPANDDVFVNQGDRILQFDSSGAPVGGGDGNGGPIGVGDLSGSASLAVDSGKIYASNQSGTRVAAFGFLLKPNTFVDSPLVVDSVSTAETRHSEEFQTTSSGNDAAFVSSAPLSGFDSAGHLEVFHYSASSTGGLECASCNPTGAQPTTDASLTADGSSITADGRVFFTTGEPLVLRDTDSKSDAYEWKSGKVELISTGTSNFPSGLLSVSADGTDAFFFTRDTLVQVDKNPQLVKIYDAREDGGFFVIPPPPSCAASDECHGSGSAAPTPPSINTVSGAGGNFTPERKPTCRKGMIRRHGGCVATRHHKKNH
ncbi:MAG TPA: hypothetical protein VII45_06580, partial [Solirubrobacterales bacterium]